MNARREMAIGPSGWSADLASAIPFTAKHELPRSASLVRDMRGAASETDEIQFDLLVALLARPEVQGRRGDFVDERDRQPEPAEIDRLQIAATTLAGVDTDVIDLG